jgi:hypothetical protein
MPKRKLVNDNTNSSIKKSIKKKKVNKVKSANKVESANKVKSLNKVNASNKNLKKLGQSTNSSFL